MLPTIKKGSEQLKFYEFRGSEDIPPAPSSGSGSRLPNKFSYQLVLRKSHSAVGGQRQASLHEKGQFLQVPQSKTQHAFGRPGTPDILRDERSQPDPLRAAPGHHVPEHPLGGDQGNREEDPPLREEDQTRKAEIALG
jgi:hypothetical protein